MKRVYEAPSADDGFRILVERLWPRGVSKDRAAIDLWLKEIAPSHELRRWFGHEPGKWEEFQRRYFAELAEAPDELETLRGHRAAGAVTFVYSSREERFNNAVALARYLECGP